MSECILLFLAKKKKERVFDMAIGILMAIIAIISFILCIVYFERLGKGLFYLLSLSSLLLFGFTSTFFLIKARYAFCVCSFFEAQRKEERELEVNVVSISPFTVDRHFASWKIVTDDGPLYWAAPLGEIPFKEQRHYSFLLWNNWIVGWREEK